MDHREFTASAWPHEADECPSSRVRTSTPRDLRLPELLLECTRAALHARHESDLGSALCGLIAASGLYSGAALTLLDELDPEGLRASFYAGTHRSCVDDLQRFWGTRLLNPPTGKLLQPTAPAPRVVPLLLGERIVGALAVAPAERRSLDLAELEELETLAGDIACAVARVREQRSARGPSESERRVRETVEHAGVGITRKDANGRFIDVNQKFCDMLGYTREELIGRLSRDFTVAEDFGSGAVFREQAQHGHADLLIGEKRYVRKDGTHIWVRRTMTAPRDRHGRVSDGISIVEDITQRKAAEEAARNERNLLRTIIDAVPHFIYVKDRAGRFTLANQAWLDARGRTAEQIRGKSVFDLFPQPLAAEMVDQDAPVFAGMPLLDVEQCLFLNDAQRGASVARWSATTKVPLHDEEGKVVGLVGISRDITERKRIEQELRDYIERFELAARATSDVIWDWDLSAGTLWWGEGIEKLFNYSRDTIGCDINSWTSRLHPADAHSVEVGIHAAIDGAVSFWSAEYRFARADGTWADVYDRAYIMRDEHGKALRMVGAMMDISERKRAEEAMRRERALLRTIIDAVPDYIHVKDVNGRIKLGNAAWLRGRRVQLEDVYDKSVFDIFPPDVAQRMQAQDQHVIDTGEAVVEQEQRTRVLDENGNMHTRCSAVTKVPMRDEDGHIIGVVGIGRDNTQRYRMERERAMQHVVARVLAESASIQQTMPLLIQTICEALGWAYGAHWTWDPRSESLKRAAWWCEFDPQFDPEDAPYWTEIAAPQAGGLVGRAWLEKRPTWESDIVQMDGFKRAASCRKLGFRSAYAFPIFAQDEGLGALEFFGPEAREADPALLEVSGAISNQIGQFLRRKQAEESLQESEQQLRAIFENADVGIAMTGLDMAYLRVNDKYCGIVGYEREELLRMRASEVNLESNVEAMREYRSRMLHDEMSTMTVEKQLVRKDGTLVWVSLASSLVRGSDGTPRYFIAVIQDVSANKRAAQALKESEEQFRILAHYDLLTGLPNRALFYDRLTQALAQARRNRWWLAVLFIDVDRFKHVNDTFGHSVGDELLKQVSQRLSGCIRGNDTVGRLSGDEFAVVLSHISAPEDAATVSKKIVHALNTPFHLEGAELFVTASIGITVFPTDSVDQDTLIRNADVAMYRAKDRGRNNYQFYTPEMNRRTREMLSMESELRRALERDELVLHYQPKVSLATGEITGLEALLRWQHPERGLVSPSEFMPLLEETGLVVHAGDWVLRAVCRQLNAWKAERMPLLPVAVNLSARQFLAPDLGESIRSALLEHDVSPELLEVEITESAIMSDTEEANRTLEFLQSLGVKSAVDDFGTGYSSLAYLKRFPLRALKIDRSFVRDIPSDSDDAHITQAVISMAHSLGLKVVAEGVETEAQLSFLLQYGCDEVQGYLFSGALRPEDCSQGFATTQARAALIESLKLQAT